MWQLPVVMIAPSPSVRQDIIDYKLNINDDYFLACLYSKSKGSPNDVEQNFLQSQLLVKVGHFMHARQGLTISFLDVLRNFHIAFLSRFVWRGDRAWG